MKIIVFCGPTITAFEASKIINAEFRPPIKHGDLISCVYNDHPDVIVIIDGVFINKLSVWHSEINEAINKGVTVYGASAMGAIRAAEMQKWGMRGVGEVFSLFSNGIIEADDEVFCDYTLIDGIYKKNTISVINLRYILSKATESLIISKDHADEIINTVKSLFYKERTISLIMNACMEKGTLNHNESKRLVEIISQSDLDIQKIDAIKCLEAVKKLRIEDLDRKEKSYQYDLFFEALNERDRGTKNDVDHHSFYKIANDYALYSQDIESLNDAALNKKICALIADNFNIEASDEDIKAEKNLFILKHKLNGESEYQDWLKDNDLTENEFKELLAEGVKINKLQNWYRTRLGFAKNTRYLLEELKLNNKYTEWKQKSINIHEKLKNNQEEIAKIFNESDLNKLTATFLKRNSRTWEYAPFIFISKIGMNANTFKYLLAQDKTLSDLVAREIYGEA